MPLNISPGRAGGNSDRRALDAIGEVYAEMREQGERLKRIEQHLARLERTVEHAQHIVRGPRSK